MRLLEIFVQDYYMTCGAIHDVYSTVKYQLRSLYRKLAFSSSYSIITWDIYILRMPEIALSSKTCLV